MVVFIPLNFQMIYLLKEQHKAAGFYLQVLKDVSQLYQKFDFEFGKSIERIERKYRYTRQF